MRPNSAPAAWSKLTTVTQETKFVNQFSIFLRIAGVARTKVEFGNTNGREEDVATICTIYLLLNLGKTISKPVDHDIGVE